MSRYDRISELPESLLTEILSHLPTKDSVKTSALSTRWKTLYLNIPSLELKYFDFPTIDDRVFITFIDRFLELNTNSHLQKFNLDFSGIGIQFNLDPSRDETFKDRISKLLTRGIKYLDLKRDIYNGVDDVDDEEMITICNDFISMPLELYLSKSLVSLSLSHSILEDFSNVCMPSLKFMSLKEIQWCGIMDLEKLVSGCEVLEELVFLKGDYDEPTVIVKSRSLKLLRVLCKKSLIEEETTLVIDASGLEYLSLEESMFDGYVVKDLSSLIRVDVDVKNMSKTSGICGFFTAVTTLECVEIKGMVRWEGKVKKVARYVLEKSPVLEKLILSFSSECTQDVSDSVVYKKLNRCKIRSRGCKIVIHRENV